MATFDSPLDVLAFDYVNFILSNLWTWIAIVTATVSFWRLRAARDNGLIEKYVREPPNPKATSTLVMETRPPLACGAHSHPTGDAKSILLNLSTCTTYFESGCYVEDLSSLWCNDGVTKGKLTVYYDKEETDGERDGEEGELMSFNYDGGECVERWERVARMRNGGDSWYHCDDLREINGNVVRLWDANVGTNGGWIKECYV